MQIELDAEARLVLASLAYAEWERAWESYNAARAETWESTKRACPRSEWPQFHESRQANTKAVFDRATRVKNAICPHSPLVTGEHGGLPK